MFTAEAFLELAELRFGESMLRARMRGAQVDGEPANTIATLADAELLKIAGGVIGRVQAAAATSVGWPFPGAWPAGSVSPLDGTTDISGELYADIWPANVLENALTLFNWRTVQNLEQATDNQRRAGEAAEKFFQGVADGAIGLGLGSNTEPGSPTVIAARNRDGSSNVASVPDTTNLLDFFVGQSWDV